MNCTEEYEKAVANVLLMLRRRGFTDVVTGRIKIKDVGESLSVRNPSTMEVISVYFITRGEKVTINKIRSIVGGVNGEQNVAKKRCVIIHDLSLTSEANAAVHINNVYAFEMYLYDDMMFDLLEIVQPYELYTGPPIQEVNKLPKICDAVTKYMAFPIGSVITSKDSFTGIPSFHVVVKSIGHDARKK